MKQLMKSILGTALGIAVCALPALAEQPPAKPKILKPCSQCHTPDEKVLRGTIGNISGKAETFAINTGAIWTVKFDDKTKVVGWPELTKIPKEKEIAVTYVEKDGFLSATSVSVKQPAVIPPDKLVNTEQMIAHVQKGDAVIIDSRPGARYYEGAIPGAINIYDAEFDKHVGKLPSDKDKLVIFYCAGPT
ncbi:MAG TPA: rhodanese-like domain-containing protein [Dissulfurispiraceae bacterium]|nr:rhodanese-like domain-containing protein [Dissulfurispiraceae bacterium]